MVFKLAWKNIHGAGLRSIINVFIISLVMIGIMWMQGMYAGWMRMAERQSREWQNGDGRYTFRSYDKYDPFSWDKSNGKIPSELQSLINNNEAVPILISQGAIYPQGRMISLTIKGIPYNQKILKLPTSELKDGKYNIPALIGMNMAKSSHLKLGDVLTMRWRDIHGAFNAADIEIVKIMDTPEMEVDNGQVWIDLARLQTMKDAEGKATLIVLKNSKDIALTSADWRFQSIDDLLIDLHNIMKVERVQALIMYAILLFLAMIAIFDTQVLAVFKRRKEIGTFAALGMTKREIIRMFTVEGMMYAMLASVASGILGLPLFIYYGTKGWKMPSSYESYGIAGLSDSIIFYYSPQMILSTIIIVILITTVVSWIPTLRIARLKPTDALRGRLS